MHLFKKLQISAAVFVSVFLFASPALAAAPDGSGPWADSVVSAHQGSAKNGQPVSGNQSDPGAALGISENDDTASHSFSLGFGGEIVLGFESGVNSGVIIVESTNPDFPFEHAKIEVSENGATWTQAGIVSQNGIVNVPEGVGCTNFVRLTDISDPAMFPGEAEGYDINGVEEIGNSCGLQNNPPSSLSFGTSPPGFPNTGGVISCTSPGVTVIPKITQAVRISPTSVFVSWEADGSLNNFVIEYGFKKDSWLLSSTVSGFSTIITDLPAYQSIWVHVAATDNCAVGSFSGAAQVEETGRIDAPGISSIINPLIPLLPDTGIGPDNRGIPLSLPTSVALGVVILLFAFTVYKFLPF